MKFITVISVSFSRKFFYPLFGMLFYPAACILLFQCKSSNKLPHILIFTKADFYPHESTPAAINALIRLCKENQFYAEVTEDDAYFRDETLKNYAAVIFLNTAGNILNPSQEAAFERYIRSGGGFMGIHTAVDTEHQWEWYARLTGARYENHTDVSELELSVSESTHPANLHLDSLLQLTDEGILLKEINPVITPLLMRKKELNNDVNQDMPVSWCSQFEGARIFITTLGHNAQQYTNIDFLQHLSGALKWVTADKPRPGYPLIASEASPPDTSVKPGFSKTVLAGGLHEPMQMDIFPDGKIIIIERRGSVKLFNPGNGSLREVHRLKVFSRHEEGLLGIAIDPEWPVNKWIYVLYTPENDHSAIQLSRFEFDKDKLIQQSEKVILRIPTFIGFDHFHAAGSLTFDGEGNLYIATGDNTKHEGGFSAIDERLGRENLDAQRSSSNTMDLKGKILRIKPLPDGSYLCPSGNLYVNGDVIVRNGNTGRKDGLRSPEIKGRLNTSVLGYELEWSGSRNQGDTGRLTAKHIDSLKTSYGRPEIYAMGFRNPFRISIDDRRKWLIVGDIGPDAGKDDSLSGPEGYDEINIISRAGFYGWPYFIGNNRPYRYYDFRKKKYGSYFNVMNPVNTSPNNTGSRFLPPARPASIWYPFRNSAEFPALFNGTRCIMAGPVYYKNNYPSAALPDLYDGRLFIYDFMRNWIMSVSMDSAGNYIHMEQFAPTVRLARPVHILFDKKGDLLVLEYGTEWYAKNDDAVLSRISYNINTSAGLNFYNRKSTAVHWDFFGRNRSFYQPGEELPYRLKINDEELARSVTVNAQISQVTINDPLYKSRNEKNADLQSFLPPVTKGQALIDQSDCRSCHALDKTINGPSYPAIARRYKNTSAAESFLAGKIIEGGSGTWGKRKMIPHPQLNQAEAVEMSRWILSLNGRKNAVKREGRYTLPLSKPDQPSETIVLFHASAANTAGATIWLRPWLVQAENADSISGRMIRNKIAGNSKSNVKVECRNNDLFVFRRIHLKGIRAVEMAVQTTGKQQQKGESVIEWRLHSKNGPLIGSASLPSRNTGGKDTIIRIPATSVPAGYEEEFADLYFIIRNDQSSGQTVTAVDYIRFVPDVKRE